MRGSVTRQLGSLWLSPAVTCPVALSTCVQWNINTSYEICIEGYRAIRTSGLALHTCILALHMHMMAPTPHHSSGTVHSDLHVCLFLCMFELFSSPSEALPQGMALVRQKVGLSAGCTLMHVWLRLPCAICILLKCPASCMLTGCLAAAAPAGGAGAFFLRLAARSAGALGEHPSPPDRSLPLGSKTWNLCLSMSFNSSALSFSLLVTPWPASTPMSCLLANGRAAGASWSVRSLHDGAHGLLGPA